MTRRILAVMAVLVLIFGAAVPGEARGGGRGGGSGHFSGAAGGGHGGGGGRGGGGGHWGGGGGGHWSGGGHGGGGGHWSGGHGHWGHHGGDWWWGGAFFGGLAVGTTLAYPWWYPYYGYPYYYPYPYDGYSYRGGDSVYVSQYTTAAPTTTYQAEPIQREVLYPNGKYVLHGDGVTQAWQWIWVPAVPGPEAPPPR